MKAASQPRGTGPSASSSFTQRNLNTTKRESGFRQPRHVFEAMEREPGLHASATGPRAAELTGAAPFPFPVFLFPVSSAPYPVKGAPLPSVVESIVPGTTGFTQEARCDALVWQSPC